MKVEDCAPEQECQTLPWPPRLILKQMNAEQLLVMDALTKSQATLEGRQFCIVALNDDALVVNEITGDQHFPSKLFPRDVIRDNWALEIVMTAGLGLLLGAITSQAIMMTLLLHMSVERCPCRWALYLPLSSGHFTFFARHAEVV